jgi:cytochrome c-type biogenesis protein CcmF
MSIASLIFMIRSAGGDAKSWKVSRRFYFVSGCAVSAAVILLTAAFMSGSYQYAYVYNYSSRDLGLIYKISGLWAGQEGSFLFWVLLLHIFGYAVIKSKDEFKSTVMSVICVTQIFILVILSLPGHNPFRYIWDANPAQFSRAIAPPDGSGLNPLLQNPWMIIHPPVLFLGYASAVIPYGYAIAALIGNDYKTWIERSYRWVLFCVTTLGIGIFLGGYWAYSVLGWGGYWGWDPVENSSLIPWLAVIVLMHGMILQKRYGILVKTNLVLALLGFILVFYSTFLTRSGVLSDFSVHSFGDLGLSAPLVFFIAVITFAGAFLFIRRRNVIESVKADEKIITPANLMIYGMITVMILAALVLAGTSMPIISSLFSQEPFSVNEEYYNSISIPFGLLILVFIAVSAALMTRSGSGVKKIVFILAAAAISGVLFNLFQTAGISAYALSIFSFAVIIQACLDIIKIKTWRILASRLSHMGIAVLILGIIASGPHSVSHRLKLIIGDEGTAGDIGITFAGLIGVEGAGNEALIDRIDRTFGYGRAEKDDVKVPSLLFRLKKGGKEYQVKTSYYINKKTNSLYREPGILYSFLNDVYVSPVEFKDESESEVHLVKGVAQEYKTMKVEFSGFNSKKLNMNTGSGVLSADVKFTIKGKTFALSPGMIVRNGDSVKNVDALLPGTKRKVSLAGVDLMKKEIILNIEKGKEDKAAADYVIAEVSFKRLIWLVWLGTALVAFGGFVSIRNSRRTAGDNHGAQE